MQVFFDALGAAATECNLVPALMTSERNIVSEIISNYKESGSMNGNLGKQVF